jgi:hypothetical protein
LEGGELLGVRGILRRWDGFDGRVDRLDLDARSPGGSMTPQQFEQSLLAMYVWQEAHEDGLAAMVAIAWTLRNRMTAAGVQGMGMSWGEAIRDRTELHSTSLLPDTRDPAFEALLRGIEAPYLGKGKDPSCGAQFYFEMSPDFEPDREMVLSQPVDHACVVKVGRYRFFL